MSRVATPSPGQTSIQLVPGQPNVVSLDVVAAADGMVYLDVVTSQGGRGTVQSVPLKVGSGKPLLKREGTLERTPSGEKIISLPSTVSADTTALARGPTTSQPPSQSLLGISVQSTRTAWPGSRAPLKRSSGISS